MQAVLATFLECYEKNKGLESVVNWKYLERPDYIEVRLKCWLTKTAVSS